MSSQFGSFLRSKNFSSIVESDLANKEVIEGIAKNLTEAENTYKAVVAEAMSAINEIKGVEDSKNSITVQLDSIIVEFKEMQKILSDLQNTLDK